MKLSLESGIWLRGEPLADGEGGFGKVYEVRDDDGNPAVAKFVPKDPGAERELLMGDSVRAAEFRNVVPVLDKGEHEDQWVIIMPMATQNLAQHVREKSSSLELSEVLTILRDIATALADIAGEIVHRDLKPQNILRLDDTWCIADFGIARYAEATTADDTRKYSLTAPYAAPEQWNLQRATSATDVYAFGVIAYQLLSGSLPFAGPDFREQHLTATPPRLTSGTARLRILIEECLYKAADARPTAANILARLDTVVEEPAHPGLAKLAQVNEAEVKRRADSHAEDVKEQERANYLAQMHTAAVQSFESFSNPLLEAIEDNAPTATIERGAGGGKMVFVAQLAGARLGVSMPQQAVEWRGPFTVITYATISVKLGQPNRSGWQGRSHSLWFCDAHEKGRVAWHETAFMASPFGGHPAVEPYSCSPRDGQAAFENVIGTVQLAWPVEELDRADPSEFLNRWIGWFADTARGRLHRPSRLPEKQIKDPWRRS